MRVVKLHNDEVDIDEVLVRRLLGAQMPQWAPFRCIWLIPQVRIT